MSWPITTPSQSFRILSLATLFPLLLSCSPEPEPKALETSDSMAAAEPLAEQANPSLEGEWGSFAADNGQSKYTSLDQIDASNVEELEIVWRRPALDAYYSTMNPAQRYTSTWTICTDSEKWHRLRAERCRSSRGI